MLRRALGGGHEVADHVVALQDRTLGRLRRVEDHLPLLLRLAEGLAVKHAAVAKQDDLHVLRARVQRGDGAHSRLEVRLEQKQRLRQQGRGQVARSQRSAAAADGMQCMRPAGSQFTHIRTCMYLVSLKLTNEITSASLQRHTIKTRRP